MKFSLGNKDEPGQNVVKEMLDTFVKRKMDIYESKINPKDKIIEDPIKNLFVSWRV